MTAADNASGGARGLRATPSSALSDVLRRRYGIDASAAMDLGGSANLNLLIDERWVVRVYRPHVTAARLAGINHARDAMRDGGVPSGKIVATEDGERSVMVGDRLVEVEQYVAHDGQMNSWNLLAQALPMLGRVHSALAPIAVEPAWDAPVFANHVAADEAVAWASRGAARMRGWGSSELAESAEELAQLVWAAERNVAVELPRQMVHGDFWDNNVLFRDGEIVLVTDLDFMGYRPRIDDLALTLYFTNSEFAEGRDSDERIRLLRGLVDAYDTGLDEALTETERRALPAAIARQPLWAAGKWVALLDDEDAARRHAAEMVADVAWALALMRDRGRWVAGFAS